VPDEFVIRPTTDSDAAEIDRCLDAVASNTPAIRFSVQALARALLARPTALGTICPGSSRFGSAPGAPANCAGRAR